MKTTSNTNITKWASNLFENQKLNRHQKGVVFVNSVKKGTQQHAEKYVCTTTSGYLDQQQKQKNAICMPINNPGKLSI